MIKFVYKKQKGISIILITLIASVIFSIALGMNGISIQQTKMMGEIGYSVTSFYAADSGAEKQLFEIYKYSQASHATSSVETFSNGASFYAFSVCGAMATSCYPTFSTSSDCLAENYCVNSVGKYHEIKRAIEISY